MPGTNHPAPASTEWDSAEWERRRARAAAFLALPEDVRGKWVVGPAVVAFYERSRDRARAREAAADA